MVTRVAMVFGAAFVLMGVLGVATTRGTSMAADPAPAMLLGLFPINLLHNMVHFAFGVWGLRAASSFTTSKTYCQVGGLIYLALVGLGLVAPTTFGLMPIGGNDIWLHGAVGASLVGAGYAAKTPA